MGYLDYLDNGSKNLLLYNDLADLIENKIKSKSVMDVGAFKGNLLNKLNNIDLYCGIEKSLNYGKILFSQSKTKKFKTDIYIGHEKGDGAALFPKKHNYNVIYFGGIIPYIVDGMGFGKINSESKIKISLSILNNYILKYTPKYIIIQEPSNWGIDYLKFYNSYYSKIMRYNKTLSFTKYYKDFECAYPNSNHNVCQRDIYVFEVI